MALVNKTQNGMGYLYESKTLPSSATVGYSSEINAIKPKLDGSVQNVGFALKASAVSGTNLDIALYGAMKSGGTKFLLKDAVVADITTSAKAIGYVDVNQYPAPFYYIGWTADANESANTIELEVVGNLNGSQK